MCALKGVEHLSSTHWVSSPCPGYRLSQSYNHKRIIKQPLKLSVTQMVVHNTSCPLSPPCLKVAHRTNNVHTTSQVFSIQNAHIKFPNVKQLSSSVPVYCYSTAEINCQHLDLRVNLERSSIHPPKWGILVLGISTRVTLWPLQLWLFHKLK